MEKQPDLVLKNGMKVFYAYDENAETTDFKMVVNSGKDIPEELKDINFAANHLLEHSIKPKTDVLATYSELGVLPKDAQTHMDSVTYRLEVDDNAKISAALNAYADMLGDYEMPRLEGERHRIFEEWDKMYNQKDKWQFFSEYFGSDDNTYTHPAGFKLLKQEYVDSNQSKIKDWLDNQVNLTMDFDNKDLKTFAKHIYGADNMSLHIKGNMLKEEILSMIKSSKLTDMEQASTENPLSKMVNSEKQSNFDLDEYKSLSINMSFPENLTEKEKIIAKEFLGKRISRKLQYEEPNAYLAEATKKGIEGSISHPKKDIFIKSMVSEVVSLSNSNNITDEELLNIQKKTGYGDISKNDLASLANNIYKEMKLSVNSQTLPKESYLSPRNRIDMIRNQKQLSNVSQEIDPKGLKYDSTRTIQPQEIKAPYNNQTSYVYKGR